MTVKAILGSDTATPQSIKKAWGYFDGESEEATWIGPVPALDAVWAALKVVAANSPDYDSLSYDPGRGRGVITARKLSDGEPVYELFPNEFMKPVELHPYFAITEPAVTADNAAVCRNELNKGTLPSQISSLFSGTAPQKAKALKLYKYLAYGFDEYAESGYVLRETKNVSKRSIVTASYEKVNEVATPPNTSISNALIGALPDGEWLKKSPVVRVIGARRWAIQQEWWWAQQWPVLLGGTWEPM